MLTESEFFRKEKVENTRPERTKWWDSDIKSLKSDCKKIAVSGFSTKTELWDRNMAISQRLSKINGKKKQFKT